MKHVFVFLLLQISISFMLSAQEITGQITGQVIRASTGQPITFASFKLLGQNLQKGTISDSSGRFYFHKIPVGRYDLEVSHLGFETNVAKGVLVNSGKTLDLKLSLKEAQLSIDEVVIQPDIDKSNAINSFSVVSSKQISMEEASRFAGGFDDPARLVSSFAGVASNIGTNGVVIRGNSPKGVLWRMEGVAIPNPNHFAEITGFGAGGITALSSKMLANSDFFTGAFPAEYGNASSGVFDLSIRNGNNREHEHSIQAGFLGIDISSEGPLTPKNRSSYLFNYRYSTFGLIDNILPEDVLGISYQDLSFKLNFPTDHAGVFSIWGLGLWDQAKSKPDADTTDLEAKWQYYDDISSEDSRLYAGILGLNHKLWLNEKGFIKTAITASSNGISSENGRLDPGFNQTFPQNKIEYLGLDLQLSSLINYKFGQRHLNRSGITLTRLAYDFDLKEALVLGEELQTFAQNKGHSYLFQAFSQSSFNFGERIQVNPGIHASYFLLNGQVSIEPRLGVNYRLSKSSKLSFGYGLHSQLEKLSFYLSDIPNGNLSTQANKDLRLGRSHHVILGLDQKIGRNTHLRIEPYFQYHFDVPVIDGSYFSMLNLTDDFFINEKLVNTGTGTNLGIDITLERYLHKGWYYLLTTSFFDSKYTGGDGIERGTRFDRGFISNVLFGKEWMLNGKNLLNLGLKYTYLGGDRIHPIDESASLLAQEVIEDLSNPFGVQNPNSHVASLTLSYRINKKRVSNTWSLQVLNFLGAKEYYGYQYNFRDQTLDPNTDAIVIPNLSYRVEF